MIPASAKKVRRALGDVGSQLIRDPLMPIGAFVYETSEPFSSGTRNRIYA